MWQSLFRNYLLRTAAERSRWAAQRDAAPQPLPEDPPPKDDSPCAVGFVFALAIEAGGLVDRMQGVVPHRGAGLTMREGGLCGRRLVLCESGVGVAAAARGAEALAAGHRPRWIVSAGFAGGLQPEARAGDIIMANQVADLAGRRLTIDLAISAEALAACAGLRVGRLLTVDRVIGDPAEKRALGQSSGALAADMETFAVAEICRRERIRFLAVRVISDPVEQALPRDIDHLARQQTLLGQLGAAAGAIVRRPASIKDMVKLKENAIAASDRLAKFLEGVVGQLD